VAGGDYFVDEGGPVMGPLLLEDGYENKVEFVEKSSLCFEGFFRARALDNEAHNEVANTWEPSAARLQGAKAPSSPWHCSFGRTFHRVMITLSRTCNPKSAICQLYSAQPRGGESD
jgi:hypothetical protein